MTPKTVITPQTSLFDIDFKSILEYKDLLFLFVRRDFVTVHKQTLLGPLHYLVRPIITTIVYTFIFGTIANISTNGVPHAVFYMSGIVIWSFFSDCVGQVTNTFIAEASLFKKVYFPRLIKPLSYLISKLIAFGFQFFTFIILYLYFWFKGTDLHPNGYILLIPLILIVVSMMGIGFGMMLSSITSKYRDLSFLIGIGLQIMMYMSPVIYPLSIVPEKYRIIIFLNPMTSVIEIFRFAFTGQGTINIYHIIYTLVFALGTFFLGIIFFNRVEKSFVDTA